MYYILDHYYETNHEETCLVVACDKTVDEMVEICSVVAFLLEDVVDESAYLKLDTLLEVLVSCYEVEDIKKEVSDEDLRKLNLPINDVYEHILVELADGSIADMDCYIIDLYSARESCCGKYDEIMEKWLPKGDEMEKMKKTLVSGNIDYRP